MDGGGVKIHRSIGSHGLSMVDPFLLLDEFSSDNPDEYIAGFPPHPHRGFETVTYIIDGKMEHEDSAGNKGMLESGGIQWMTAGKGVIHSEMPMQDKGLMRGFQLWLNLPAKLKMMEPRYQNIEKEQIPDIENNDYRVKIIAGDFNGTKGPVNGVITDPVYMDVEIFADKKFEYNVPGNHSLLAYVFEGEIDFGTTFIKKGNLVIFKEGDILNASTNKTGGRFLVLAAKPLKEPVARSGPFVMNTNEEIVQAYKDFGRG